MDVLGSSKTEFGLVRRRPRIDTPEINTYHRQILFCEKKYDKLNKKFRIPEINQSGTSITRSVNRTPPTECWTNNNYSVATRNSRKNSVDKYNHASQRRKSSIYLGQKRQSITSPQQIIANNVPARCSSESKVAAATRNNWSQDDKFKQHRRYSKKELQSAVRHEAEKEKVARENLRKHHGQDADTPKAEDGATSAALEELNIALRREREQFLRALTTLAINRITTDKSGVAPVERNTTFTHYERNIGVLADASRLTLEEDTVAPHLANDNNNKDASSASSSSGSDIYGANDRESGVPNPDKRERINRLRNYLKCSGFGDPDVIRTTTERSENEKRAFSCLIKKINRGLSCEKQERLRRKARLEYEMSLMKGESFCEQQEQVYMRTASADMENRDVQLLEDELRMHALREIRKSKKDNHVIKQKTQSRQESSDDLYRNGQRNGMPNNGNRVDDGGEMIAANHVDKDDTRGKPEVDEKSCSDDRDAMSGLIRNPLSRREMRQRILLWVYDVEEATGGSQKEGDHQNNNNMLEKTLSNNDSDSKQHNDSFIQDDNNLQ